MRTTLTLSVALALLAPAMASTKTLTVLGDKKVKTQWDGKMPKAMTDQGIETNVTGLIISGGKLVPTFGFDITSAKKLLRVQVEDVTGKKPVLMIDDPAPTIARAHWRGDSAGRDITPEGLPWLFTRGDTLTVYRFTVHLDGDAQPVVIYQPCVFPESSKAQLRNLAAMLGPGR